jgi:hypothetical protein
VENARNPLALVLVVFWQMRQKGRRQVLLQLSCQLELDGAGAGQKDD